MAQKYDRQSSFIDGDTITAALFNDEYNQLQNAFNYSSTDANSTGHRHDGSAGQGGNIYVIGDLDFLNKIEVDSTNNRWGIFTEVGGAAVEQVRFQDGAIVPVTDNDIDLGASGAEFKDLYIDGTANIDVLQVNETLAVTSNATVSGNLSVTGSTSLNSTLSVSGIAALLNDVGITGDTTINSTLNVVGAVDFDSTLNVDGNTTLVGTLNTQGAADFDSTVNVDGAATLASTLAVTGATTLSSTLAVSGNATLNGNTTIGNAATDTLTITADVASNIIPSADSTYTIGDASNYWSNAYIDAVTTTGNVSIGGNLTVTGNATINGNLTFGDAATDTVAFGADINSSFIPDVDNTYDLGSSAQQWKDLYINGVANIDSLVADTADINAGTIDNTAIGGTTASTGNFSTLSINGTAITSTSQELNKLDGATVTTSELNILDGDTTASAITVASTDKLVYNDAGTMIQVTVDLLDNYYSATTKTITNKTIDADNNSISNLEVDNLKSGVLDTDISSVSASHDTLPSALAVKTYVDSVAAAQNEASELTYSNTTSGLSAVTVQAAIDEVEGRLDTAESNITTNTNDIIAARNEAVAFAIALG